jgi:hypothetical protein
MKNDLIKLEYDMSKLVTAHDMRLNFKALSDLLFIKFAQVEDIKMGLRDTLVFQKYFYPLQMQILITKCLDQL